VVSTSIAPGSSFPLGTTTVTGKATDASGNEAVCATSVIVVDQEPPTVSALSVSSAEPLWPPNHRMVDVTVGYGASDNCGGSSCVLSVSSNEPVTAAGDDNTAPDWEVVDAHHVRLRAERSNAGIGRTYTITLTCTDAAGNRTVRSATVFVPHDRRTTG
jgi:hypothetical protein